MFIWVGALSCLLCKIWVVKEPKVKTKHCMEDVRDFLASSQFSINVWHCTYYQYSNCLEISHVCERHSTKLIITKRQEKLLQIIGQDMIN